jgi:hypothetical protein
MNIQDKMPLWVALAFSNIRSRKVALYLVYGCATFTAYCIPWTSFFVSKDWVEKVFLIDGWSWAAMMAPTTFWYWLGLRWMDRNNAWPSSE